MRQLVPHFILEKYLANETRGSLPAAGIFVDLSGFSTMTDALAVYGQLGAETLTQVMRGIFEPLVEAVYAQGGFVVGYAGDAFQAIFLEDAARAPAALRGLAAVAAIQEHTRTHPRVGTSFGEFPISLKAGLGYGEVTWLLMNSSDHNQATYCVRGSSVDNSVEAEENAQPGQIVLDSASQARLAERAETMPAAAGFHRVERLLGELPTPRPFHVPQVDSATLGLFYPESVIRQPNAGEFRPVVNVFIDIPIDPTDEAFVTPFMENVFLLQKRYDGFFLRPDLGDKGFNLLLFWGATTVHENNVERSLNFLLDLHELTGISFRAGVSYRQAYSGFMGASMREDYTAYGWGVNLAARMMSASGQGEVWMEEEVARRAERHFDLRVLGEYSFKGFSHKIKTFALVGRGKTMENIYRGEMVGREAELARWQEFITPLKQGKFAGVFMVKGEAGIGKSRLVYEIQHSAGGESLQWVIGQTDEILRQSLNPFEAWLRARFHFSDDQADEINWRNFDEQLQSLIAVTSDPDLAAELTRTRTVLAAQLNLTQPGSFYDQLDAKGRYENTFIALSALLQAGCLQKPLVLFIEDLHWLDEDTRAFLPYLVRNTLANPEKHFPLALLTTTRPEGVFPALNDPALLHEIQLERLPSEGLSRLAEGILEGPASPSLTTLLERRSEGNPFFAEQILRYLAENNLLLHLTDGTFSAAPRAELSMPTDVSAVLIARLDKLTREVREVVQTASVLGREFEVRLLAEMLRDDPHFVDEIKSAEQSDIWFALNELAYMFRHALLRDAAYSMQLQSRQRELHAVALQAMETFYKDDLESHYGELAYHAEQTGNSIDKAMDYLLKAGRAASALYQNAPAANYFTRLLSLIPQDDIRLRLEILLKRAIIYSRTGERELQQRDLIDLEGLCSELKDEHLYARVLRAYTDFYYTTGDYQLAVDYGERAVASALLSHNIESALGAYISWSHGLLRLGKLADAMQHSKRGLELARAENRRLDEGKMLSSMGLIALEQNNANQADVYLNDSLQIAREIGNLDLEARGLNNLAISAGSYQGNFALSQRYYEEVIDVARRRGDRYLEGIALGNLGFAAGMQGDFPMALTYLKQGLFVSREVGNRHQEIYTLINLSAVAGVQGQAHESMQYAVQANQLSMQIHERSGEAWSLLYLGHASFMMKNYENAWNAYERSVAIRVELSQPGLAAEPIAGMIDVALERDDLESANELTQRILTSLDEGVSFMGTEEPLRIYLACYRVLELLKDQRARNLLQDAKQILDAQVMGLRDDKARRMYVENVPWRREIQRIWEAQSGGMI
jgi:predicted ATPase/class 3 adenylate cyclase